MSNEFVLVPRKLTREMLDELTNGDPKKNNVMKLRWEQALRVSPTEQYQGEPVALPARKRETLDGGAGYRGLGSSEGWNACLDEIAKLNGWSAHGK